MLNKRAEHPSCTTLPCPRNMEAHSLGCLLPAFLTFLVQAFISCAQVTSESLSRLPGLLPISAPYLPLLTYLLRSFLSPKGFCEGPAMASYFLFS